MKYLSVILAYVAVMMHFSHYYQMYDQGVILNPLITLAYIFFPVIGAGIAFTLLIILIALKMHFDSWLKNRSHE